MCLGLAAQIIGPADGHPDLAVVDMAGVQRTINIGLLDELTGPGDWVLVHMGFALSPIPPEELDQVLASMGMIAEERKADSPLPEGEFEWT